MKTKLLCCLLLIGPAWLAGCEYYSLERLPVQKTQTEKEVAVEGRESVEEQGSTDEVILPQTDSEEDVVLENDFGRAELEKEKQDLEKTIADLQEELEKAKADQETEPVLEAPQPKQDHVVTPRAGQMAQPRAEILLPAEEEISRIILGEAETELDRVGGDGAAGSVEKDAFSVTMEGEACAINKIVAHSGTVVDRLSFFFEEPDNIVKGLKGFYDSQEAIGGSGGSITSIVPPAHYVFTAFVAYVCPRPKGWDISDWGAKAASNDQVICGFRPIAKKMDSSGLVDDVESLWFGPTVGTPGITTGDLFGPRTVHSISSGDFLIKQTVASGRSSREVIDYKNTFFYETCPAGQVLAGFRGEGGQFVDRLIGVCKPVVVSKGN